MVTRFATDILEKEEKNILIHFQNELFEIHNCQKSLNVSALFLTKHISSYQKSPK